MPDMKATSMFVLTIGLVATLRAGDAQSPDPIVTPEARVQTEPIEHGGDAADDPAIWINSHDPGKSLIIGTDKHGGLNTYTLDGKHRQTISEESHPDNVDVLYEFPLAGVNVDLAIAGCRAKGHL